MKKVLLACLAVAATASSAHAAPGRCVAVTDPRGDASSPGLTDPGRVDLVAARVVASTRGITATLTLDGPPEGAAVENLRYAVDFTDGKDNFRLTADKSRLSDFEFVLQVQSGGAEQGTGGAPAGANGSAEKWTPSPASGSIDLAKHTVTLHATAALLGSLPQGKAFTVTDIAAWHGYVTVGFVADDAGGDAMPLVVGDGRCRR